MESVAKLAEGVRLEGREERSEVEGGEQAAHKLSCALLPPNLELALGGKTPIEGRDQRW